MKFKFNVGQKVRVLDGSGIRDYAGTWCEEGMGELVGKTGTIRRRFAHNGYHAYKLDDIEDVLDFTFDERGLKAVEDVVAPGIIRVIFSNPATIVLWADGTKTVVKAHREAFDPEKGLAMCFMKKALGNKSSYNEYLKKLTDGVYSEKNEEHDWKTFLNPSKSGWYIAITSSGLETDIHYSHEHKLWNAFDEQSPESANNNSIKVIAWRHLTHAEL